MLRPFHLAYPVHDLDEAARFYGQTLGCRLGRRGEDWLDIDFFGSQIVAHQLADGPACLLQAGLNMIDGQEVPLPHFGAVLHADDWRAAVERLRAAGVAFLIEPHVRYTGAINEQSSMVFPDPSGNVIELKSFADPQQIFARD